MKKATTSHVIHSDGSYSNDTDIKVEESPKEECLSKTLKEYDVILFADNRKWIVLQLLDWGLGVASWPRKTMPSIEDSVRFSWEELEEQKIRKL